MYQDYDHRPAWQRILTAEFRLFRAFGVTVNMAWTTVVWPLFFFLLFLKFYSALEALALGVLWTVVLLLVVYTHEMGHILAGRRLGVSTHRITLHALGGLAHMDSPAPNAKGEMIIALAGPITHVPWWVLFWVPAYFLEPWVVDGIVSGTVDQGWWIVPSTLYGLAGLQVSMMVFNILPFYPLDGGRVLRAALAMRMHPNRASLITANVGFAGAVVLGIVGLTAFFARIDVFQMGSWGLLLVILAVINFMACRRLQMQARWSDGPYEQVEEWQKELRDPIEQAMAESRRLTEDATGGRKTSKKRKPKKPAEPTREDLQRRVDRLLDRINEVGGIENLSKKERKELEEASRKLQE